MRVRVRVRALCSLPLPLPLPLTRWGSVVVSLMFWGFANEITTVR